MITSITMS